ncbi:hypothetical protein OAE87_01560, partial [bacterium]|nr:hypothetical protein [bacterium]
VKRYQKHIEDHSSRGLHAHAHIIRVDTVKASSTPMRMKRPRKNAGQFLIRSGHSASRKEELSRG